MGNPFPLSIDVRVYDRTYGATSGFGRKFEFIFTTTNRSFTLTTGRGNNDVEEGVFTFSLPSNFHEMSYLEKARVLMNEYERVSEIRNTESGEDFFSALDRFSEISNQYDVESLTEETVFCSESGD